MNTALLSALHEIEVDKGIPFETVKNVLEESLLAAYENREGAVEEAEVVLDRDHPFALIIGLVSEAKVLASLHRYDALEITQPDFGALQVLDDCHRLAIVSTGLADPGNLTQALFVRTVAEIEP